MGLGRHNLPPAVPHHRASFHIAENNDMKILTKSKEIDVQSFTRHSDTNTMVGHLSANLHLVAEISDHTGDGQRCVVTISRAEAEVRIVALDFRTLFTH